MGITGGSTFPAIRQRMKITFGFGFDGFRSSVPVFNHLYCGPQGLVEALELRLGLAMGIGRSSVKRESPPCEHISAGTTIVPAARYIPVHDLKLNGLI
jgi:hypothetical protein